MKIITSQLLFTCFLFAFYFSIQVYRKWDLHHLENRLFSGLCFASGIWSLGFYGINIQVDAHKAYLCRTFGMLGVFAFLIIAQIMIAHLSTLPKKISRFFILFSYIGIPIYIFLLPEDRVIYHLSSIGMTYSFVSGFWNNAYVLYTIIVALMMAIALIYTIRNFTYEYIHIYAKKLFYAELLVMLGMLLDTVFPLIGIPAFPGSTIGQFVGLVVMYDAIAFINNSRIDMNNLSRYVYSSISSPVLVYDNDLKLKIINDAAFSFLGINELTEYITIDSLFKLKSEEVFQFEGNRKDLDTESFRNQIPCNLAINKIMNDYNDLIGYIIIVTDISERMQAFKKLEEVTREATNANQAKTTFLANMSHEIRTPMNAIIGFSELVLKMNISQEVRSHVEDIRISSHNLLAIINDILDITKIESGKMELVPEDYYLNKLLDDVSLIISQQAQKKGLDFHMQIDPNVPCKLHGDKVRIRGVLINILNNAVKYTKKGYVSFELSILEYKDNRIKLAFKISDSGIGIRKEDFDKIYKSFERLDQNVHHGVEGSGLGLAIANGYVSLMGGEIQIDSEYGKGSVFTVIIEQEVVDATVMKQDFAISQKSKEALPHESLQIHDVEVLIVDDNFINLRVAKGLLSSYGLTVSTATNGQDAIEMCREKHYPLIFMDQMMPEIDGVTAMKKIRQLDPYYAPGGEGKIIVLTADAIRGVREQLLEQGFDEYLGKPMNMAQLERLLIQYLPEKKVSKVIVYPEDVATPGDKSEDADIIYLQKSLPGVDVQNGLRLSGKTLQNYLEILKITYIYGEKHLAELKTFLDNGDYDNYTIKIHSLKSTSKGIGAETLSDMALSQEMAGKEKRFSYIDENFETFQEMYRVLLSNIRQVLRHYELISEAEEENKPVLEEPIMQGILANIRCRLDEFDFAAIFELLEQVEKYQMNEKQSAFFEQLRMWMDNLDTEKIYHLLDSYE